MTKTEYMRSMKVQLENISILNRSYETLPEESTGEAQSRLPPTSLIRSDLRRLVAEVGNLKDRLAELGWLISKSSPHSDLAPRIRVASSLSELISENLDQLSVSL